MSKVRGNLGLYGGDARGVYGSSGYGRHSMIYMKPRKRWPKVLLVLLLLAVCVFVHMFACSESDAQEVSEAYNTSVETEEAAEVEAEPDSEVTTVSISAIGDLTLGTDVYFSTSTNFDAIYNDVAMGKAAYFFAQVLEYTSADDLTIGNFEGTLTTGGERQDKTYAFKGSPSYAKILKKGSVEAVNLANNHAFDYGYSAYEDTKEAIDAVGVTSFGYDRNATYEVNGIKVGLLGINVLNGATAAEELMLADIAELQEEGCQLIIASFHWGTELDYVPDSSQVALAHAAIDAGADLVLGTHPHVLQGVEIYNERYICYSLGNFCFGGNSNPTDYDTMIFQQTFTFVDGELSVDADTLAEVAVIPCSVSSTSVINNYQPCPKLGDEATALLKKLNKMSRKLEGEAVIFSTELDETGRASLS